MEERAAQTIQKHAFRYLATSFEASVVKNIECPICLDQSCTGIMLPCKHSYHTTCLTKWVVLEPRCPLCRASVIDQRSERVLKLHQEVYEYFKLPIETLLEFQTSVSQQLLIDLHPCEVECKIRILDRNLSYLKHSASLTERYRLLREIQRDVELFDKRQKRYSIHCENESIECIRRRLQFQFQHLYGRTKNYSTEMERLNSINTPESRLMRSRLVHLLEIEKKIQQFVGMPILSSRAIIPFPSRQNALTNTFPRTLMPRALTLEELSAIS